MRAACTSPERLAPWGHGTQKHYGGAATSPRPVIGFLLIGLVAGWLAGRLMKGAGFGLVGNLVLGVVGAFVGGFALRVIGFDAVGLIGELITATLGAVMLLVLGRVLKQA